MKTDRPVLGVGVEVAPDRESALKFLEAAFRSKSLGSIGQGAIVEEFVEGIEVSAHAFCDGTDAVMMPFAQDHKRLLDGDTGPNTCGMGAVAPYPHMAGKWLEEIRQGVAACQSITARLAWCSTSAGSGMRRKSSAQAANRSTTCMVS